MIGWVFFTLTVKKFSNATAAAIAGLLLILCPAWSVWSMMARGYHVSGFVWSQLCLFFVARLYQDDIEKKVLPCGILGVCLGLLLLIQGIWFVSLIPFVILLLLKERRKLINFFTLVVGFLSAQGVVSLLTIGKISSYWSPDYFVRSDVVKALKLLPERVLVYFSGAYSYGFKIDSGPFISICAVLWCLLLTVAFYRSLTLAIRKRTFSIKTACFLSMIVVLVFTLFINKMQFGYRHFLPLSSLLILFITLDCASVREWTRKKGSPVFLMLMLLIFCGAGSLLEARQYTDPKVITENALPSEAALDALIEDLTTAEIKYVYCLDAMLQWNIIFAGREQVIARWRSPYDRRPEYPRAVDKALFTGENVAVVGTAIYWEQTNRFLQKQGYAHVRPRIAGGRYFWIPVPDVAMIKRMGFRLIEPETPMSHQAESSE